MSLDVYLSTDGCEHCGSEGEEVFSRNITHNLNNMAEAAGVYEALWRPEEIPVNRAGDLVHILETGLQRLLSDPKHFEQYNPDNGWGDYDGLVSFVRSYLNACKEYPNARIRVSR